jgi:hypothetical protein
MQAARRLWLGIILSLAVPGAATPFAQEPPEAPAEEAAGAAQPQESPGESTESGDGGDSGPSDEDFIPSERIPADASIAFPVDI